MVHCQTRAHFSEPIQVFGASLDDSSTQLRRTPFDKLDTTLLFLLLVVTLSHGSAAVSWEFQAEETRVRHRQVGVRWSYRKGLYLERLLELPRVHRQARSPPGKPAGDPKRGFTLCAKAVVMNNCHVRVRVQSRKINCTPDLRQKQSRFTMYVC